MNTRLPIACARCGTEFTSRQPNAKYCTSKCRNAAAEIRSRQRRRLDKGTQAKTCATCNTPITPDTLAVKYCSSECRKEAKRKADREFMRKWRQENPELNAERRKRENPDLRRQRARHWRERHPKEAKSRAKAWRKANRDVEAARQRRWRRSPYGKEAYKAAIRKWTLANPELAEGVRLRRAKAEAEGSATPELIAAKWEASDKTCCLCLKPIDETLQSPDPMSFSLEHLTPISRGGRHDIDNIGFAHRVCNSSKGNRTLEEFRERLK